MARTSTEVTDSEGTLIGRAGMAYPALSLSSSGGTTISQVNKGPRNLSSSVDLASSTSKLSAGFNDEFAYICGLRDNVSDRSNVAFLNLGTEADGNITLKPRLCPGDGTEFCDQWGEIVLAPGAFVQYSVRGQNPTNNNLFMTVERISGTAPYYAYGVINDNVNSDGSFVPPFPVPRFPVTPTPAAGLILPVIVQTGTFSSELILTNTTEDSNRSINFTFVADAVTTSDHTAHFTIDLSGMIAYQMIIPDIFAYMRDHSVAGIPPAGTTVAGALFATAAGGDLSGVFLGARTSAAGGTAGGRFGLFYTAVPYGQASSYQCLGVRIAAEF